MEKSNSQTSQPLSSRVEGDSQIDEQPTTSRRDDPDTILHNMNDFKSLDVNSADEVRQAMKAVLTGHLPPQSFLEDDPDDVRVFIRKPQFETNERSNAHKTVQRQLQRSLFLNMKSAPDAFTGNPYRSMGLKRRGRPMKAGTSKSAKRQEKDSVLYKGKLSNVVQFKRPWASESESDADSVFY